MANIVNTPVTGFELARDHVSDVPSKITTGDELNVYSQFGEDGVIGAIFARIGEGDRRACEFGAWDGKYCSNVAGLIERGWNALLIEADLNKFGELQANYRDDSRVVTNCSRVEPHGENSLQAILQRTGFGSELDLLSIDIDGDDYWVLAELMVHPRVICIEFNPTFGPWHDYVNPRAAPHGSSMTALIRIAKTLGYSFVYATYCNLFFVRNDALCGLHLAEPSEMFKDGKGLTIVGSFFDGGNVVLGPKVNKWSGVRNARAVQPLSWLRSWPQSRWRLRIQQIIYDNPLTLMKRWAKRGRP